MIEVFVYTEGDITVNVPFDRETYINATEVYKAFGKSSSNFLKWRQKYLTPYAERLLELGKIPNFQNGSQDDNQVVTIKDLVIIRKGGNNDAEKGTWFHPKLAIQFARWLSMDFEIWCDEKIDELLNKGYVGVNDDIQEELDKFAPISKAVLNYARSKQTLRAPQILSLYEAIETSYMSPRYFRSEFANITKVVKAENVRAVYEKLIKELVKAYNTDKISRNTRDELFGILNTNYIKLLKRRLTMIEKDDFTSAAKLKAEQEIADLEAKLLHREKINTNQVHKIGELNSSLKHANTELEQANKQVEELETILDDPRPVKFDIRTLHTTADYATAIQKLAVESMHLSFGGILKEDTNKVNKKYPDWKGDSTIGGTSSGVWLNDGDTMYLTVALNRPPYSPICKMDLFQSPGDEDVFVGTDTVRRHFATFNKVTGNLIVYRKR